MMLLLLLLSFLLLPSGEDASQPVVQSKSHTDEIQEYMAR